MTAEREMSAAVQMSAASDVEASQALRAAREVFGRTLACWAGDLLTLQRRGRHVATWSPHAPSSLRTAA